jgi:hypothetical protein
LNLYGNASLHGIVCESEARHILLLILTVYPSPFPKSTFFGKIPPPMPYAFVAGNIGLICPIRPLAASKPAPAGEGGSIPKFLHISQNYFSLKMRFPAFC